MASMIENSIQDIATQKRFYRALIEKDPSFVGSFFVAVKTTSVFCISTCYARKPKFENVEFFSDFKAALAAGFRPCKLCRPTENASSAPDYVCQAIDMVRANPKQKISDAALRDVGIQPSRLRRWFNAHYGMTFQAFARMYRINEACIELGRGKKVTNAALDAGYESLSGFGYTYRKMTGAAPSSQSQLIVMTRFTTPLGPMFAAATQQGLCLLEFTDRRMLEKEFEDLQRRLKTRIVTGENSLTKLAIEQVSQYFDGDRTEFEIPLHTPGTQFQQEVWVALQKIPAGQTRSYQQQAKVLGTPKAVRAVARANGMNRIAIVIPCHRVIGKDGSLTGYAGGLQRKRWLLDHESEIESRK